MWDSINTNTCDNCFNIRSREMKMKNHHTDAYLGKENLNSNLSPMKTEDISLYESSSPVVQICTSPTHCTHNIVRRPLEDHDSNSQDSGYSASYNGENSKFSTYTSPSRGSFGSFESGSITSMEEDFLDFADVEPLERQENVPKDLNKLLNDPLIQRPRLIEKTSPRDIRPLFRRALSLQNDRITPNSSRVRSCLFKTGEEIRPFKRPEPPNDFEGTLAVKRSRIFDEESDQDVPSVPQAKPLLQRAFSATEESIMSAVQRSSTEELIGDFSKSFCLPLTQGKHQDLKAIDPKTLASLMNGHFNNNVASFKVIDCRYPYEFEGGHIMGAVNIYTKEQCLKLLDESTVSEPDSQKRNILVFHCEFSSERGPNLYRFLRKQDRHKNEYPSLNYPEVYLLEGGYKQFFQHYSELCVPNSYKEMLHPDHSDDLRHFRQKSKTWNMDSRQRPQFNRLKKLGL